MARDRPLAPRTFTLLAIAVALLVLGAAGVGLFYHPFGKTAPDQGEAERQPPGTNLTGSPPPDDAARPDNDTQPPTATRPASSPEGPADANITIDTSQGPHGGAPVSFDRRLYGMNIADWAPQDYSPEPDPTFTTYLGALQPGILRWPAGISSQERVWERAPEASRASKLLTMEMVDDFIGLARAVKAEPVIAVNTKTSTARAAADLVHYVNVEKGYGVRWWQLGNEPDFDDGHTRGARGYVNEFLSFAQAMRAVDPSIQLVGGELMTGAHIIGSNGAPDWATPILRRAGHEMDAFSWHYYPLDSTHTEGQVAATPENLLQEGAADWRPAGLTFVDEVMPAMQAARGAYAPGVEVWVTEYGEDPIEGGAAGVVDTHAGALWAAEVIGRFAGHGVDAMAKFLFKSGAEHRFTLLDETNQPRPAYATYWLYANHFGNRMVNATSDSKEHVNAHTALRDDGALTVMLVNKDAEPRMVGLGFDREVGEIASTYVIEADALNATHARINGVTLDAANVARKDAVAPAMIDISGGLLELAPLSVTLLIVEP